MDDDEAKESGSDCASGAARAMCLDASCENESTQPAKKQKKRKRVSSGLDIVDKESASAEFQQEIDALYVYYKEVSGYQLNPEELACLTGDSNIACLLEESSLSCAKLTDTIYKRMKLQDGVTESSVRNSVLNIGRRSSYGICATDVDELEDESDSCLWCWETQDLTLLPSHLHSSLSIRRRARKLIHERILALSGNLAAKDAPNTHSNQNSRSVNAMEAPNLDEICSFVEKSKQETDADITKMHSKTKGQELQATRKAVKEQKMMARQIENEQKKKDRELKHIKEKSEKEAKRVERENKRLKKHQEEAEKAKKRKEKEEAELKRQASTKKQANFMECLFIRKPNNKMESPSSHHLEKTICSKSSGIIDEAIPSAATSAMDCTLSEANHLRVEKFWGEHVSRWRKLCQYNRLHHWGVRRCPKVQLFPELKLQKSSASASCDNVSTPTKEQSSQESTGSLDIRKLLDELKRPSDEKNIHSRTAQNSISSPVFLVKKLLQFDRSFRPAYYGTLRKMRYADPTAARRKEFMAGLTKNVEGLIALPPPVQKRRPRAPPPTTAPRRSRRNAGLGAEFTGITDNTGARKTVIRSLDIEMEQEHTDEKILNNYAKLFGHPLSESHVHALAALFGWTVPVEFNSDSAVTRG